MIHTPICATLQNVGSLLTQSEQGFCPKKSHENRLMMWEESERAEMERLLKCHGLEREDKNLKRPHLEVQEYKRIKDLENLEMDMKKRMSAGKVLEQNIQQLKSQMSILKGENEKLTAQRFSPYKNFFYSSDDKKGFVMGELDRLQIPYRETENGFECQKCFINQVRDIEKQYKPKQSYHRDKLRDDVDKFIILSKTFDEFLVRMKKAGYEIKQGKYLAVKPKHDLGFIRLKSLGENPVVHSVANL